MEHTCKNKFHTFSPTTFSNKLIFFTRNNFQTLINIVIADSTYLNMVQCAASTTMHAMIVATQKKTWSYVKRTSKDTFIPLAIKTYDCLHSRFNSFFITCVQPTIAHDFAIYFSSHNVYLLLLALYVHNLSTCASHCKVLSQLRNIPHLFHTSQLVHLSCEPICDKCLFSLWSSILLMY
jgi:hypothetical protein